MPQPILGIKGTAEYVEASGNGTLENPYVPTVYVANPGSGGGGAGTVTITGTLPSFTATPTFNIGTAPNLTFTNTSFIANAGTNLNTSLLALEGGNLANINTKLPSGLTVSNTRLLVNAPSRITVSSATVTRPANTTPYTANSPNFDVYGGLFELQNIGAAGEGFYLLSLDVIFNISAIPTGFGNFVVYLFSEQPTAIADNSVYQYSPPSNSRGILMTLNGYPLFANLSRGGGSVVAESLGINHGYTLASTRTSIWGYLVTLGGFTPNANSETFTISARVTPA